MGFLNKVKKGLKKGLKSLKNRGQLDDELARKIYDLVSGWPGNTGLKFYERSRWDLDDKTVTTADGQEIETKELEIKNEKWKSKVQVPAGTLKLEIEDKGKKKLEVEGKVKETKQKAEFYLDLEDYAFLDDNGEIAFKNLDALEQKLKQVIAPITGN